MKSLLAISAFTIALGGAALVAIPASAQHYTRSTGSGQSVRVDAYMGWKNDCSHQTIDIDVINPLSRRFQPAELFHEVEFLLFNVIGAAAMPFYVMWLVAHYGPYALVILAGAQMGLFAMDFTTFALAAYATPKITSARLVPYVIGYSIFNGIVMRTIRLAAYLQEWVFRASYSDTYVPDKVHMVRG